MCSRFEGRANVPRCVLPHAVYDYMPSQRINLQSELYFRDFIIFEVFFRRGARSTIGRLLHGLCTSGAIATGLTAIATGLAAAATILSISA
jgi:hypothetical protein